MQTFDIKLNTASGIVEMPELNMNTYFPREHISTFSAVTLNAGNNGWPKYNILTTLMPQQDFNGYDAPWPPGYYNNTNLIPYPYVDTTTVFGGITFTALSNGLISVSGGTCTGKGVAFSLGNASTNVITLEAGTYTLRGTGITNFEVRLVDIDSSAGRKTAGLNNTTFTINSQHRYYVDLIMQFSNVSIPLEGVTIYPQLVVGDSLTPWSNICQITGHTGTTFTRSGVSGNDDIVTVQFPDQPGTVYGGTFDFASGKLTVTHVYYTFTGNENVSYHAATQSASEYVYFNTAQNAMPTMKSGMWTSNSGTMCNMFPKWNSGSGQTLCIRFGTTTNGRYIFIYDVSDLSVSSANDMKSWLATNSLAVTYPLETPVVYQLSQVSIPELTPGQNTLYTESGDITVKWYVSQEHGPTEEEIMPAPVIVTQPTDQTVEAGSTVTLTVSATGAFSYQWQRSTNSGRTWINNTSVGSDTNTQSFVASTNLNGRMYRCVVSNTVSSTISDAMTLTVTSS